MTQPRILVVGGGPAGVAAAVAAAERGASVTLIEASQRLGGAVTAAMHRSICGLYASEPANPLDTLNDSFQRDLVRRMHNFAPASLQPRQFGKAWVLEFLPTIWESCLADACATAGVDSRFGTRVVAAVRDGNHITAVDIAESTKRSRTDDRRLAGERLEVDSIIDCTGGGQLLQLCGEDTALLPDPPADRMLGGYSIRCNGLTGDLERLRLLVPYMLAVAVRTGELPDFARLTVFYPAPAANEGICKLALPPGVLTPVEVNECAAGVIDYLHRNLDAFAAARVIEQSPHVLPRDGLRLRGKYVMQDDDIATGRTHAGAAVRAWWPAERWDAVTGPTYAYPPVGQPYDIPDGALQSAVVDNLYAAGNAVSATAGVAASIRASGICLATGARAGELAFAR